MARLTYKEWHHLPTEKERAKRYKDLSVDDQFMARCTTIYDESNPFPFTDVIRTPKVVKRPSKEEYRKRWEDMYNWVYRTSKGKEEYDENMADLEKRLANYDKWPFPCDIIFKDDIYEQ